jgi:hypothetical protein
MSVQAEPRVQALTLGRKIKGAGCQGPARHLTHSPSAYGGCAVYLRCGDTNWWRWPLHPRQRHDLDYLYPCAGHLQMRMVFAEYLRGRVMRFGLHNRIASDLIFCV